MDFVAYGSLPEILFPVNDEFRYRIEKYDLQLMYCDNCSHIFQRAVNKDLNSRIYKELYKFYPFTDLESFQQPYRKPFDDIFNFVFRDATAEHRLLEIGCSSELSMSCFLKKGFHCTGVDPSSKSIITERVTIFGDSYENILFEAPFDVIVLRFALEHIIDLDFFMKKLCTDIKPGGRVFVQVPSTKNFIKAGNLCVGAHEHIHYFSKQSVASLFMHYGFDADIVTELNMPSLIGCFTKNNATDSKNDYLSFANLVSSAGESLADIIGTSSEICFFGAGLQLTWILFISGIDFSFKNISIVDDNPVLHGKYMPGLSTPILPFNVDIAKKSDVIILSLNPIYYDKVIQKIKSCDLNDKPIGIFNSGHWRLV